jgi:hypothetical protein
LVSTDALHSLRRRLCRSPLSISAAKTGAMQSPGTHNSEFIYTSRSRPVTFSLRPSPRTMRLVLLLLTATLLVAQVQTGVASADFGIELGLVESRPYQQTELIPVSIRATGRPAMQEHAPPPPLPQEPRAARWQFGGFLVNPPLSNGTDQCGIAAKPCFLRGNGSGGRMDVDFEKISDLSVTTLNDYIPVSVPSGRYQISALARKLVLTSQGPMSASYGYANPPEIVVSNTVELQIIPATPQWISQTIVSATSVVQGEKDNPKARNAAKQLAFLDAPAAWTAILSLLPAQESTLLSELSSTAHPGPLCDLLQVRISTATQTVSSQYLSTMTSICSRANVPPPLLPAAAPVRAEISPVMVPAAQVAPPDPARQAYFEKQHAYVDELMVRSTNALAASLGQKQTGAPKVEAIKTLLGHVRQLQYNRPRVATPNWAPGLALTLVNSMPSFSPEDRRMLIPLFASTLPTPSAAPAFEWILDDWKPGRYFEEPGEALKALYKVDPRRARERILAELTKEQTWLQPSLLDLLPATDAPQMDDALVEALAGSQKYGAIAAPMLLTSAIARYATPQALPRIRAIYESQTASSCQPELVAYFLRTDPAYASRILNSTSAQSCLVQYFERTAALIMNPTLEGFIASYLMKDAVYIKTAAAKSLGNYGSEGGRKPLWDTLRYFHDYWNGKGAELAKNGEGIVQEEQLGIAIAHARSWVATEADLQMIQSLCIAERCLYQIQQDLQNWRSPLRLEINEEGAGIRGSVGQYSGFNTLAELEAKLAQFPTGTSFLMNVSGPSYDAIETSLRRVASGRGLLLQSR